MHPIATHPRMEEPEQYKRPYHPKRGRQSLLSYWTRRATFVIGAVVIIVVVMGINIAFRLAMQWGLGEYLSTWSSMIWG